MTTDRATESRVVFAFDDPAFTPWTATDDPIMGGRSRSQFCPSGQGRATFSGVVSLENGGGFCSVRSPSLDFGWAGHRGVSLRVLGDGKTYTFCLHTRALMPGMSYRCRFAPPAGSWHDLHFTFDQFVLMRFGFRVGVDPVNPDHVRGVSLLISDQQEGPFALELAHISLWR